MGRVAVIGHLSAVKLEVVVVGVEEDDQHVAVAAEKYFLVTITVTIAVRHISEFHIVIRYLNIAFFLK